MNTDLDRHVQFRELALAMRGELDLDPDSPFDPWQYAALHGHHVVKLSELDDTAAEFFRTDATAKFSGAVLPRGRGFVIIDNDGHCETRRRNTMSHELAHITLGHRFVHDDEARIRCGFVKDQEAEADTRERYDACGFAGSSIASPIVCHD